ncbi:PAS domain S-box protein [Geomonas anaerohicana]|uniref:histidine kinase n=1 Tax=Geomonas anaerohicana TaxID=2798583 RepID=A0ABS0YJD7_9BACT|nr:PAS domain S-box protein [Geomonas anaerohicana]MBJ6752410.1 PAS domain S-box protein [Geomonas anaerohicana]
MPTHRFRRILSLQSTFLAVIPFLLVVFLNVFLLLPHITQDVAAGQRELARAFGVALDNYLSAALTDVRAVAALPLSRPGSLGGLQEILDAEVEASGSLNLLYAVLPDGRIRAAGIPKEHRHTLQDHRTMERTSLAHEQLFRDTRREGKPVWSNTFPSAFGKGVSIAVGVPSGDLVVIGEVDLAKLIGSMRDIVGGAGQDIILIDGNGQVIADQGGIAPAAPRFMGDIPLVRSGLASGQPVSGEFRLQGRALVGTMMRSSHIGWYVLVAQPVQSAYRSVVITTRNVAAGAVAALLLALSASLFLARRLSRRLEELAGFARRVATGHKSPPWPPGEIAEVEQLAGDLLSMADEIRYREQQLVEGERLLRSVTDHAFHYQGLLTPDGTLVDANRTALALVGATKEAVIGLPYWDTPWWRHAPELREQLRASIATGCQGIPARFETTHLDHQGELRHVDFSLSPIRDEAGAVIYLVAEGRDITDFARAKSELKESEERFYQVFLQNDDPVILMKLETLQVIDANPAALALYGLRREELQSLSMETLIDAPDLRKLRAELAQHDTSQGFLQRAASYKTGGEKIVISLRGTKIRLKDEELLLCSIRDISEKLRLEQEIRATQAKLIQTNKMTSLGMLVSSVAHEINNPNHCISINNTVLTQITRDALARLRASREAEGEFELGGFTYDEVLDMVPKLHDGIRDGSQQIDKIVRDMKNFSKPAELDMQGTIDVNRSVENSAAILWHHIQRHTDKYRMELWQNLPTVQGSQQQIDQVVINLVMNALQSLPDKNSGVVVTTWHDRERETVNLSVEDEGDGMSEEVLARLTEPFFTMRINKGGTGLGLYISSSIVKEHGGSLAFESEPGRGTKATVTLPALAGSANEPAGTGEQGDHRR